MTAFRIEIHTDVYRIQTTLLRQNKGMTTQQAYQAALTEVKTKFDLAIPDG